MKFNSHNKVLVPTMNDMEARAFIKFLQAEIHRHERDIDEARALIRRVEKRLEAKGFKASIV